MGLGYCSYYLARTLSCRQYLSLKLTLRSSLVVRLGLAFTLPETTLTIKNRHNLVAGRLKRPLLPFRLRQWRHQRRVLCMSPRRTQLLEDQSKMALGYRG